MAGADAHDVAGLLDGRIGRDLADLLVASAPARPDAAEDMDLTGGAVVRWMFPEPVATVSSTLPFTVRLRSNVASAASAGTAASATPPCRRCNKKCFIAYLAFYRDSDQGQGSGSERHSPVTLPGTQPARSPAWLNPLVSADVRHCRASALQLSCPLPNTSVRSRTGKPGMTQTPVVKQYASNGSLFPAFCHAQGRWLETDRFSLSDFPRLLNAIL